MTMPATNPVCWTEIPVTDLAKAVAFYNAAMDFGLTIEDMGPNPVAMIPTKEPGQVAGHFYPGKPMRGTGPTVHFEVPGTVEAALEKWTAAGGSKVSDIITIPPGRFAYVEDLDGNSIGLFQHTPA